MTDHQKLYDKLLKQIKVVENNIKKTEQIHQQITSYALVNNESNKINMNDFRQCAFRKKLFQFKTYQPISHCFLDRYKGQNITFGKLCEQLSTYICNKNLFNCKDNTIICDDFLKLITKTDYTTFFILVKNLRKIIN
jgi:hypothetical protein